MSIESLNIAVFSNDADNSGDTDVNYIIKCRDVNIRVCIVKQLALDTGAMINLHVIDVQCTPPREPVPEQTISSLLLDSRCGTCSYLIA